eukprot:m.315576 g.315576  ORF g.315576 m.315576 type:complete len:115 (+) comp27525_c0_seq2:1079-1423(+)
MWWCGCVGVMWVCVRRCVCMWGGEEEVGAETDIIESRFRLRYFALASTLGFGLNLLSFWIIQLTSSVMLKIISVARTAALVLWCAVFLHEKITSLEIIGYTISLVAFAVYNRHQ